MSSRVLSQAASVLIFLAVVVGWWLLSGQTASTVVVVALVVGGVITVLTRDSQRRHARRLWFGDAGVAGSSVPATGLAAWWAWSWDRSGPGDATGHGALGDPGGGSLNGSDVGGFAGGSGGDL